MTDPTGTTTAIKPSSSQHPGGSANGYTLAQLNKNDPQLKNGDTWNYKISWTLPPADQLVNGTYSFFLKMYDGDQNKGGAAATTADRELVSGDLHATGGIVLIE